MGNLPNKANATGTNNAPVTWLTVSVAARYYLGLSADHTRTLCQQGMFEGARKPGTDRGGWRIPLQSVINHLNRKVGE